MLLEAAGSAAGVTALAYKLDIKKVLATTPSLTLQQPSVLPCFFRAHTQVWWSQCLQDY